ncbi:hypothetical protein SAMN05421854_107329 [Amycolatopsis rubida]|uniref:Uncharacterized protein n=1 Tax=Amycolatopsis rubida TaxID=112413 RepID=A0A1I5TZZ6_9PSEU|nr:hypothetical protein SAMN05421854_107329 [Amycolatopsis rubida]
MRAKSVRYSTFPRAPSVPRPHRVGRLVRSRAPRSPEGGRSDDRGQRPSVVDERRTGGGAELAARRGTRRPAGLGRRERRPAGRRPAGRGCARSKERAFLCSNLRSRSRESRCAVPGGGGSARPPRRLSRRYAGGDHGDDGDGVPWAGSGRNARHLGTPTRPRSGESCRRSSGRPLYRPGVSLVSDTARRIRMAAPRPRRLQQTRAQRPRRRRLARSFRCCCG